MGDLFPFDEALRGLQRLRQQKDEAYQERNQCVALVARMALRLGCRAGLAKHPESDTSWDADWRNIVFVDLPAGQVSWHLHDLDLPLFDGLPAYPDAWDGHSTFEKYRRVNSSFVEAQGG